MNFLANKKVAIGLCLLMGIVLFFTYVPLLRQVLVTDTTPTSIDPDNATTTLQGQSITTEKNDVKNDSTAAIPLVKKPEVADIAASPLREYNYEFVESEFKYDSSIAWQQLNGETFKYSLVFVNSFLHEGGLAGIAIASSTKGYYYDSSGNPGCTITFHIISSTSISYTISDEDVPGSNCFAYHGARAYFMPNKIHTYNPETSRKVAL